MTRDGPVTAYSGSVATVWLVGLEHHSRTLTKAIALLGVAGMLIVSGATMLDIILRWTTKSGVVALNEITGMVFAVTIAACLPYGVASRINLKLDLLEGWVRGRLAAWTEAVGMLFVLVFLGILTWRLAIEAQTMVEMRKVTMILGWRTAPFIRRHGAGRAGGLGASARDRQCAGASRRVSVSGAGGGVLARCVDDTAVYLRCHHRSARLRNHRSGRRREESRPPILARL